MDPIRYISWPVDLIPPIDASSSSVRLSIDSTESVGGIDDAYNYRPGIKRSESDIYRIDGENTDALNAWHWMKHNMPGMKTAGWYNEPMPEWRERIRCQEGDGVSQTCPVPLVDETVGPFLRVAGALDKLALVSGESANLLTDQQAICENGTYDGITTYTGSSQVVLDVTRAERYYYGYGLEIKALSLDTDVGFRTDLRSCPPSWPITGIFWALGDLQVRARVAFFDASEVFISTVSGDLEQLYENIWTPVYVTATSPSNAAFARVIGVCPSTNKTWYADCRGLMTLDTPQWWLPSYAPQSGLLSSVPADGAATEASGTGLWQIPCGISATEISSQTRPQGHVDIDMRFMETWRATNA
jgi:hypothetical protein